MDDEQQDRRKAYDALIARFKEGWETGNAETMADIFSADAAYYPSPFDTPVKGTDAIKEYWKDVPMEQSEIAFRYGEIFEIGPWFATEFKCTFRRRRTGEPVDIRGALFCETTDDKISEMRMYWHRTIKPRS